MNHHVTRAAYALFSIAFATSLTACGGGGGGGGGGTVPPPPPPPSISGDMMALSASRGWNYQGNGVTISTYYDPQPTSGGIFTLIGTAVAGSVPTVLTSANSVYANVIGVLGIVPTAGGNQIVAEISVGSSASVPGSPIVVPNTVTQGQVFTPSPGVTATVTLVGTVPGASACPTPAAGATVQYVFQGLTRSVSYVPGCGITQYIGSGGATYTLVSVGNYASLGQLSRGRSVESLTLIDTARSLLGLNRNDFPAAHLVKF